MSYRHCASCLISIELSKVKVCGKCKRRAYCSKECQSKDWNLLQGHKNWCEQLSGEEDIDWELYDYGSKGFGIRAKKTILPLQRILVDGNRTIDDPVVEDLFPLNGSISEKVYMNRLACDNGNEHMLCARMSRINHSCNHNAIHIYDDTYNVKVLVAEREITSNEEICITYQPWDDPSSSLTPVIARSCLQMKWQIICDSTCLCYDKDYTSQIEKVKTLDKLIYSSASQRDVIGSSKYADELENIYDEICVKCPMNLLRLYYDRFQIYIMRRRTLNRGIEYMKKAFDIKKSILHPNSREVLEWKKYFENPRSHRNYMLLQK
eukprot:gene18542-24262_t